MNTREIVCFSIEDIYLILDTLEQGESTEITCVVDGSTCCFSSIDKTTELLIGIRNNKVLVVPRVMFQQRRQGLMTKVFNLCREFCKKEDLRTFIIQSVESPEMAMWCSRNHFKPVPATAFENNGIVYGDYSLRLS